MSEFLSLIKQAALDAVYQEGFLTIVVGTVTGENPVSIRISQKLVVDRDYLIRTRMLSSLRKGDKVVMLREGDRFLIIDKVVS